MFDEDVALRAGRDRLVEYACQAGIAAGINASPSRAFPTVQAQRTVSPSTLRAYRRKGLMLLNEYVRSLDPSLAIGHGHWPEWTPSPVSWVRWLIDVKSPTLAKLSWRLYRRSALELLYGWEEESLYLDDAIALINANCLETYDQKRHSRYSFRRADDEESRTSARRIREFTPIDLALLLGACFSQRQRAEFNGIEYLPNDSRPRALADILVAGLVTGLRPCEWRQCCLVVCGPEGERLPAPWSRLIDNQWDTDFLVESAWPEFQNAVALEGLSGFAGQLRLVVYNSKHSNGRGNIDTRAIDISLASPAIQASLIRMMIRGRAYFQRREWSRLQSACVHALAHLNKSLFPGRHARITLYSCRHQALANFKNGVGVFGAAVLAGHGCGKTAGIYYASAKVAWPKKWVMALNNLLDGNFDDFYEEISIASDRSKKKCREKSSDRGRRKSKGSFSPDVLRAVAELVRGISLMRAPEPATAEVSNLLARMKQSELTPRSTPEASPFARAQVAASPWVGERPSSTMM
jgi:hypothetical protein